MGSRFFFGGSHANFFSKNFWDMESMYFKFHTDAHMHTALKPSGYHSENPDSQMNRSRIPGSIYLAGRKPSI